MRYPVVVTPDLEDGGFVAECPAISGCVSEGETIEEAMANIRDAIEGCLAVLAEKGEPLPPPGDALLATVEVGAP
jgi:predicted RNase H-like HicB family nuclease